MRATRAWWVMVVLGLALACDEGASDGTGGDTEGPDAGAEVSGDTDGEIGPDAVDAPGDADALDAPPDAGDATTDIAEIGPEGVEVGAEGGDVVQDADPDLPPDPCIAADPLARPSTAPRARPARPCCLPC